jgi:hypothetical protein
MTNAQKTPLARALENFTTAKALDQIALLGKALPASVVAVNGSIVTVKFEIQSTTVTLPNVTVPKAESQWFRAPTQIGDLGVVIPADVSIGAISGLGASSAATLSRVPNLSALQWLPTGNKGWSTPPDPNKAFINGPNGVVIQDTSGACVVTASSAGVFTVAINGVVIFTVNSSGATMPSGSDLVIGSVGATNHTHGGVQSGSDYTGPPTG